MSFFLSLLSLINVLQYQIIWKDTVVEIPLYEDVSQYIEIPNAELFLNGKQLIDEDMYYTRNGVERTFLHTVNNKFVGTYSINYRVTFPSYQKTSIQSITFKVVDVIAPEFIYVPTFRITLGSAMPKVLEGLIYQDNYDQTDQLIISANTSEVILNRVGTYKIYYQLKDVSGNQKTAITTIEVYDHLPPTIEKLKQVKLNVGHTFTYSDYYRVKDNVDPFPKVTLDLASVQFHQIGTYDFTIIATDQSGLSTIFSDTIEIVDTIKPTIILTKQSLILDYGESMTDDFLRSLIVRVSDNYDDLKIEDVYIYHDIESTVLGTYKVYYEIKDSSLNSTEIALNLTIKDLSPPIIKVVKEMRLPVFSSPPLLHDYIEVSDSYDHPSQIEIKITGTVKMDTVSSYLLTIKATDSSKNDTTLYTHFEVYDDKPPELTLKNEIIITEFKPISYLHYLDVKDQYDKTNEIRITIDDTKIDYERVGIYPLYISAIDRSSNIGYLETEVMVIDVISPILSIKQSSIYLGLNDEPLSLSSFIVEASDNYDPLAIEHVEIISHVIYQEIGVYDVIYSLKDSSQNETTQTLKVIIQDLEKPVLIIQHVTIESTLYFDVLAYVSATDNHQILSIHCACEGIDFSKPGMKKVYVYATDVSGNFSEDFMTIEVIQEEEDIKFQSYLPIIMVCLLGGGFIFLISRRRL